MSRTGFSLSTFPYYQKSKPDRLKPVLLVLPPHRFGVGNWTFGASRDDSDAVK